MRSLWSYLKYSNLKVSFDLNPFCGAFWSFKWMFQPPTASDPNLRIQYIRFLFVSVIVVIDNGVFHIWEQEAIEPVETKGDPL